MTFINNDVALSATENLVLDLLVSDGESVHNSLYDRLATVKVSDKPDVACSARLPKVNA